MQTATTIRSIKPLVVASLCLQLLANLAAGQRPDFEGLGNHHRQISSASTEAQACFDQGLAFLYSFNHDEAMRSFARAAKHDPNCSAIHWAIALANGPHINFPMVDEAHATAAWQAISEAKLHLSNASAVEKELLAALEHRYANPQPADRRPLDESYAKAMRQVWKRFPADADVGALFAEALMDLWPWDLWSADGQPRSDTLEILKTLETVLGLQPDHPLALHLYVHALEASPFPERAALAAERLRTLQPGLGHMVHMPSHIDVRLGAWQRAIDANELAIKADAAYRLKSPDQNFFRTYMAHNHHMLAFAAMMDGKQARSTAAIRQMLDEIPPEWLAKNASFVDGAFAMPYELHLRFGRWDEMLEEPEPMDSLPIARAFRHFARGVAWAAKLQPKEARQEQRAFLSARAALPENAMFVMNPAVKVLSVAESMLEGEILYRENKVDESIAALREAVRREEELRYIEPPDWIQPVRHVLGATLMDARRFEEAEAVYRQDLARHPNNGWSLFGLSQSLQAQGKEVDAAVVRAAFDDAWNDADVKLTSSCFCLPENFQNKNSPKNVPQKASER